MLFLGKIGITLDISFPHPKTDSAEDKTAAELALQFYVSITNLSFISSASFYYFLFGKTARPIARSAAFHVISI